MCDFCGEEREVRTMRIDPLYWPVIEKKICEECWQDDGHPEEDWKDQAP